MPWKGLSLTREQNISTEALRFFYLFMKYKMCNAWILLIYATPFSLRNRKLKVCSAWSIFYETFRNIFLILCMNHFLSLWPCDMYRDNVCYHMFFPLRNWMSTDQTIYSFVAKLIFIKCRVYWVKGHAYHKQIILLAFLTKQCILSHYYFYFIELMRFIIRLKN